MLRHIKLRSLEFILSICLLAAGVITFFLAVMLCVNAYTTAPFADTWNIIDEIVMNHGQPSLHLLWTQHNEHRLAIPKLLMWADLFWLGGDGWSLFVEIYIVQLFEALLMAYAVRRLGGWDWSETRMVLGVALFCAFCPIQYEVFVWSFGIQVVPAYALTALALIAITFYSQSAKAFWLVLSLTVSFAAPLTLAGGQVVWPALCFAAWNLKLKANVLYGIFVCGITSISLYLIGYVSPAGHANIKDSLARPFAVAHYVLLYFAASWDALGRPLGYVLTLMAVAGVIAWNCKAAIRRDESLLRVAILAIAASLIVNALITALGRISFGLEQAATSRYQTSALLFWCCIFILTADLIVRRIPKFLPALASGALLVMLLAAPHAKRSWQEASRWAERIRTAVPPLVADVKDDAVISTHLIGTPYLVFRDTDFLRAQGMSIYNSFEYRRMGVLLTSIYAVSPADRCVGYFERFEFINDPQWPGYRAFGWGWDRFLSRPIEKIIITNEAGRITGLALSGLLRPDVKQKVPGVTSSFTGWQGYQSSTLDWRQGHAFGELPGGREVCALPGTPLRPDEPAVHTALTLQ